MTPEDAFLLDILSDPDDRVPRLIYADWLEDEGDPRAALVRQGCEVLAAPAGSAQRRRLREAFHSGWPHFATDWIEVDGLALAWRGVLAVFRYRLAEAIAWCAGRSLPLCSPELEGASKNQMEAWSTRVQRVTVLRTQRLAAAGKTPRQLADDTARGRLLVYVPLAAATEPSVNRGEMEYLDGENRPAWDCWLTYGEEHDPVTGQVVGYVVAWVPEHLVNDINRAMMRHPRNSIRWAEDFDRHLTRQLRDAGLIH